MSKIHSINIPTELRPECWHQYDRHQKAWLIWRPKDCEPLTDLHELAHAYFSNPKIGRKTKPPILVWEDGRVRIQFVGNYKNSAEALSAVSSRGVTQ